MVYYFFFFLQDVGKVYVDEVIRRTIVIKIYFFTILACFAAFWYNWRYPTGCKELGDFFSYRFASPSNKLNNKKCLLERCKNEGNKFILLPASCTYAQLVFTF